VLAFSLTAGGAFAQGSGNGSPSEKPPTEKAVKDGQKKIDEIAEASRILTGAAGNPECVWLGRRVVSLLWRDDLDTAFRHLDLYDRFGCSAEHLKLVFRCVIQQGPIDPKAADRLASRVHNCWIAPEEATTASSQTTIGPTTKTGTIPN